MHACIGSGHEHLLCQQEEKTDLCPQAQEYISVLCFNKIMFSNEA